MLDIQHIPPQSFKVVLMDVGSISINQAKESSPLGLGSEEVWDICTFGVGLVCSVGVGVGEVHLPLLQVPGLREVHHGILAGFN